MAVEVNTPALSTLSAMVARVSKVIADWSMVPTEGCSLRDIMVLSSTLVRTGMFSRWSTHICTTFISALKVCHAKVRKPNKGVPFSETEQTQTNCL